MTKARDIASASPAPSTVSATELGYLDGVTSAIQTQIDSKIGSASAISPTLIDAKGDLIVGSAADTPARLAVGTNGYILTADSAEAAGMKWAAAAGGGGKVLQVVQGTTTTETTVASTTFTDTTLSASITPSATSSKVLVLVTQNFQSYADAVASGGAVRLLRGSTSVYSMDNSGYNTYYITAGTLSSPLSSSIIIVISFMYLDSPATTSSTTYKTQTRTYNTANGRYSKAQPESVQSNIILMEIGA